MMLTLKWGKPLPYKKKIPNINHGENKNDVGNFQWGAGGGRSISQGVTKVTFKFLTLKDPRTSCTVAMSVLPEAEVSSFECCQEIMRTEVGREESGVLFFGHFKPHVLSIKSLKWRH